MKESEIIHFRHLLHAHPGLSGEESFAHDLIVSQLQACQATKIWDHVGGYGVVAVWGREQSRPTLVFRADTDALPIQENTPLPYRSEIPFVSHKCGHDGHTAILLRFAQLLGMEYGSDCPSGQRPNIMLVFQPEEETGKGSQKILDAAILQQYNIRGVFGIHNLPGFPKGTVVLNHLTFAAASTGVVYNLYGRQTHASTPEKGINPGLAVAEIIQRFQALNTSPNCSFDDFQQSTLIAVRVGEEAFGTSAGNAQILFTLRTFSNARMESLLAMAQGIVDEVARKYRLSTDSALCEPFYATENHSRVVEQLEQILDNYRQRNVLVPFRWSEDFANYLLHFPGAMFGIGAGEKQPELHHPDYDFPDDIIEPAASMFLQIAREFNL